MKVDYYHWLRRLGAGMRVRIGRPDGWRSRGRVERRDGDALLVRMGFGILSFNRHTGIGNAGMHILAG